MGKAGDSYLCRLAIGAAFRCLEIPCFFCRQSRGRIEESCLYSFEDVDMPMHDWTSMEPGIFHAFHHGWIQELARLLNQGLLPADYYALTEQVAAGFGPDVLTLQNAGLDE